MDLCPLGFPCSPSRGRARERAAPAPARILRAAERAARARRKGGAHARSLQDLCLLGFHPATPRELANWLAAARPLHAR